MTVALGQPSGPTVRTERWRWEVLDDALAPMGTLTPILDDIPDVAVTVGGNVNRTLRGLVLEASDVTELDPARDWLAPSYLDADDGAHPLGVYRIADAETVDTNPQQWTGAQTAALTLADGSVRQQARTSRAVGLERDLPIASAVARLADWQRIRRWRVDPTTATIGTPLAWPMGEASWAEVNQVVAKAGGMLAPHFDNAGVWRWRVAPDWASAIPDRTYSTTDGSVEFGGMERAVALLDDPNVFYVVGQGGHDAVKGRYPIPDEAPNSIARIGYEIPEVIDNGGVDSTDSARAAARAAAGESDDVTGPASLSVPFDPDVDLFALVVVDGWRYRSLGHGFSMAAGDPTSFSLARLWLPADAPGTMLGGVL